MQNHEPQGTNEPTQKRVVDPVVHDKSAHVWLWTGVSIFAFAILAIWVVNTKAFIENTSFGKKSETNLLELGKQDYAQTVRLITESDNTGELLQKQEDDEKAQQDEAEKVKTAQQLKNLLLQLEKENTTATSTTSTATTSTSN